MGTVDNYHNCYGFKTEKLYLLSFGRQGYGGNNLKNEGRKP